MDVKELEINTINSPEKEGVLELGRSWIAMDAIIIMKNRIVVIGYTYLKNTNARILISKKIALFVSTQSVLIIMHTMQIIIHHQHHHIIQLFLINLKYYHLNIIMNVIITIITIVIVETLYKLKAHMLIPPSIVITIWNHHYAHHHIFLMDYIIIIITITRSHYLSHIIKTKTNKTEAITKTTDPTANSYVKNNDILAQSGLEIFTSTWI
jgi:hypothetical protein